MQIYVWPLLQTLFSEVLTSDEWLRLFDNVFSNHPAFLLLCVVAYYIVNRGPLLRCTELDDIKVVFVELGILYTRELYLDTYSGQWTCA